MFLDFVHACAGVWFFNLTIYLLMRIFIFMFKDGMSTLSRAAGRGRHFQGQRAEFSDRPRRNAFPAQNGHFARDVHAFRPHSGRPPRSRKICSVQGPAQGQPPKPIGASKHQRDKTDKAVNNSPSKKSACRPARARAGRPSAPARLATSIGTVAIPRVPRPRVHPPGAPETESSDRPRQRPTCLFLRPYTSTCNW